MIFADFSILNSRPIIMEALFASDAVTTLKISYKIVYSLKVNIFNMYVVNDKNNFVFEFYYMSNGLTSEIASKTSRNFQANIRGVAA